MVQAKQENMFLFYLLTFTWGLIWTLLGAIISLVVFLLFRKEIQVKVFRGRVILYMPYRNFGGISLGLFIISDTLDTDFLKHEVGHSIQNTFMGPLFIPLVAIPSGIRYQLFEWLSQRHRKKHGTFLEYDSVWFEAQATSLGHKHTYIIK